MANKKVVDEDVIANDPQVVTGDTDQEDAQPEETPHVVEHLDRDLNDPRNAAPTPQLPSLNDPGQS